MVSLVRRLLFTIVVVSLIGLTPAHAQSPWTPQTRATLPGRVFYISPDGKRALTYLKLAEPGEAAFMNCTFGFDRRTDHVGPFELWDLPSGRKLRTFLKDGPKIAFLRLLPEVPRKLWGKSNDVRGRYILASVHEKGRTRCWSLDPETLEEHRLDLPESISFSRLDEIPTAANPRYALLGMHAKRAYLVDLKTGTTVQEMGSDFVRIGPRSTLLYQGEQGLYVKYLDKHWPDILVAARISKGDETPWILQSFVEEQNHLAILQPRADGRANCRIWDLRTNRLHAEFASHQWPDRQNGFCAISLNGRFMVVGSRAEPGVACLDLSTGKWLGGVRGAELRHVVHDQSSGRTLALVTTDDKLHALDVATGKSLWSRGVSKDARILVGPKDFVRAPLTEGKLDSEYRTLDLWTGEILAMGDDLREVLSRWPTRASRVD